MSNPSASQNDPQSRRLPSTYGSHKTHTQSEDSQPNESISRRGVEAPPRVGKARVPLPRKIGHGASSSPAGLHTQQETWILAREQLSVVDSLNSTIKHNGMRPQHRSQDSSPARLHRSSTDSRSPPAKRRKLAQTSSTSLSSLAATSTSFSSTPSSVSSNATQPPISPLVSTQSITNSSGQQPASTRKVPLSRPILSYGSSVLSHSTSVDPSDFSQARTSTVTPTATPSPTAVPQFNMAQNKPSSLLGHRSGSSPQILPPYTPSSCPAVTPQSETFVKAEPMADTLLPSSAPHPPTHGTPQHAAIKSEPVVPSIPSSPSESSHLHEHAASGTQRVHPIPANCRQGAQNWTENRNQWMKVAVRGVKLRGLKVTGVKMLSDGLVIDWERPPNSHRSSRSSSASTRITAPSVPSVRPPNSPSSARATQPSPPQSKSAASVHAPRHATVTMPPPTLVVVANSSASLASPQHTKSIPLPRAPASSNAPKTVSMSKFAELFAMKKKIQAERQAAVRRELELDAVKRREEAARKIPSPLPTTPSPPPDSPPRFRLDTPPPPWETDNAKPAPEVGVSPTSPSSLSPTASHPVVDASARTISMLPSSSPHGTVVSSSPKPSGSVVSSSRGSSASAVQKMVQLQDYSDDDDMYMDPNDLPRDLQPPLSTTRPQDIRGNVVNTDNVMKASDPDNPTTTNLPADSAVPTPLPPPTSLTLHSPSVNVAGVAPVPAGPPEVSESASSILISATQEGLQTPDEADREKLEDDALEWLKQYIFTFDADRAALAAAYSQHATFSIRHAPHRVAPSAESGPPAHGSVVIGPDAIRGALLGLPAAFSFHTSDAARPPTVQYDLVVAFDMIVYGTTADAGGPGIMVVCYIDPTGPCDTDPDAGSRWVCEMQLVLRRRCWNECDGSVDGGASLVALSHQMTLRTIPRCMRWDWR